MEDGVIRIEGHASERGAGAIFDPTCWDVGVYDEGEPSGKTYWDPRLGDSH